MNILLTTLNAKYIHKNLALRWIYQSCPNKEHVVLKEYTIKEDIMKIAADILQMNIDVAAFSIYIWNIEQCKALVSILKQQQPDLCIIAGGPEVSFASEELLDQGFDALSIGEGEQSIWEYMEMLASGQSYEISGIYTKDYPNRIYRKVPLDFLETLPDPYFMEIDADAMDKQYLYFETSRGCPYSCAYCLSSVDTYVRMFSESYVFQMLEKIAKSKIKQVKLLDRTFNANPQRALLIARYMNEHCIHQVFQFEVVAETLSDDLLHFFCKEADKKRFRLEIGVQSFHAKTLKAVGRIQNNERLKEVIIALRSHGVRMHVDLIAGLPYEDYASFKISFDTLFAYQVKEIQLGILKLLKGTKLKQQKAEYGFFEDRKAPYTIQKTRWLSEEELELINGASVACEKFYNSGKLRESILEVLRLGWLESPFDLFVKLGVRYQTLPHPYPAASLYRLFLEIIPDTYQQLAKCILTTEYYSFYKQRPVRLWKQEVTTKERKDVFQVLIDNQIVDQQQLYHYGVADLGYADEQPGYQVIIFQAEHKPPLRYFIDKQMKIVKELVR